MAAEPRADKTAIPWPTIFGVTGGMNTHITAAGANVTFERRLLGRIEHVTGRGKKDDCGELHEICVVEIGRILAGDNFEIVLRSELANSSQTVCNGGVAEPSRF